MNITDLGEWEAYRFQTEDGLAIAKYRNASGEDWYTTVAHNPTRPVGIAVLLAQDGTILMTYDDIAQADPRVGRPVVLGEFAGTAADLVGCRLDIATGRLTKIAPAAVSKAQAQMALFNVGLLDDLEAIIKDHPYRPVRIWYESANYWERKSPYVAALGQELNLTDEQIDDLFIAAAKL